MQDEVREKSVALTIKVGKAGGRLTAGLLKWAIRKYLAQAQNPKIHHGKQTVKQLVSQGAGVQNIEITGKNIKSFERVARKYGVDFALKKDPAQGKYLVFFKARDADALNAAFAEYGKRKLPVKRDKCDMQSTEKDRAGQPPPHLHGQRHSVKHQPIQELGIAAKPLKTLVFNQQAWDTVKRKLLCFYAIVIIKL